MAEKLRNTASGLRHVRWAKKILATVRAHLKHNYLLSPAQQVALGAEVKTLDGLVTSLQDAVTPYRAFVDEAYLDLHASQTVADYLCDEAQREASGRLQPRRKEIDAFLASQGGFKAIFSKKPLSRVLHAGRVATEAMARTAGNLVASIPVNILDTKAIAGALLSAADVFKGFLDEETDKVDPQRTPLKLAVNTATYNLREGLDQIDGRLRSNFSEAFIDSLYPELKKGGKAVADEEDDEEEEAAEATDAPAAEGGPAPKAPAAPAAPAAEGGGAPKPPAGDAAPQSG